MRNLFLLFSLLFSFSLSVAQELNASITIDSEQTGQNNLQVFRTLQNQLEEFVNNTVWTDQTYLNQERIDCNFTLIVASFDGTAFSGSLQVQSSRPVFNSTYNSPIYNYNDQQVSFNYKEFEPLFFNINSFDSNLVSIIAYHVYTIIGLDASTFERNGGDKYFEIAKQIVNTASSSTFSGWKATDGTQSRFRYNDAMISPVYSEFHTAMYDYHRNGLDNMAESALDAKLNIITAIGALKSINDRRPNSFLLRTFFDAKADEIKDIFSGGPQVDIAQLKTDLTRMAPTRRSAWNEIKL